jgi:acyl carrier protein
VRLGALLGELFPELGRSLRADDSPDTLQTWDSIKQAEIVLSVEQAYGVDLTTREIQGLKSVGALVAILEARGLEVQV